MRVKLIDFLACPDCGGNLQLESLQEAAPNQEIDAGELGCNFCNRSFPIINGVPAFALQAVDTDITARGFGQQWSARKQGRFERDAVFGFTDQDYLDHFCFAFTIDDLSALTGVSVEAGIGSGNLVVALAQAAPNAVVIGMDISNSVFALRDAASQLPNLHLVQCDLTRPPLRKSVAERVYTSGVLHHLREPAAGVKALWPLVSNSGKMYFWVYPAYPPCAYDRVRRLFVKPFVLPVWFRFTLAWMLAPVLWAYFRITGSYSYKQAMESLHTVAFRLFDNFTPQYQHRVTQEQVRSWCSDAQVPNVNIVNDLGVVCSRG